MTKSPFNGKQIIWFCRQNRLRWGEAVFNTARIEIVAFETTGEADFPGSRKNDSEALKWIKWPQEASSQSGIKKPLSCPKNGERVS